MTLNAETMLFLTELKVLCKKHKVTVETHTQYDGADMACGDTVEFSSSDGKIDVELSDIKHMLS